MAVKKSELYSSLWQSCDELRGSMDASQYKDYVLVMLFIKYVSDKYANQKYASIIVPDGASFADMRKMKGASDIGDRVNKEIIAPLYKANNLTSAPDFNDATKLGDGKEMVDRLTNLIAIFEDPRLDFSKNRADGDDILGDAYEYLMRHFATQSGKSKGQFYTPAEVSRVVANVLGIQDDEEVTSQTTVYDPTCGSGSLLLRVANAADKELTLYGQEKDAATTGLARMNMILHDQPTAEIKQGNTLANPLFLENDELKRFDYIVANPPFSDKRWSNGVDLENDPFGRFKIYGTPPAKQGDYAYLLHIVRSLKRNGTGACILPHGVLFRGNVEATIREKLIREGLIKGIIGLPANLFYGTGIPACIIVVDKKEAKTRDSIFMIDASQGFIKDGNKNRLREMDIHRIVDYFTREAEDDPRYARRVPISEIEANEFNLNIPRYIDSQVAEDVQDISAHLLGGIPQADIDALNHFWEVFPGLRETLFTKRREGYVDLAVKKSALKDSIVSHPEFIVFSEQTNELFTSWCDDTIERLGYLEKDGFRPKALVTELGETLLAHYEGKPLIDHYVVYQHFMNYWHETMQDDAYLIVAEGWKAETRRVYETVKNGKNKGKEKDVGWECDLVPKALIIARYFDSQASDIAALSDQLETALAEQTAMKEEHDVDDGILADVGNKTAAESARNQVIENIWVLYDRQSYNEYSLMVERVDRLENLLKELRENPLLTHLRNSKGNITMKSMKNRVRQLESGDEYDVLERFLSTNNDKNASNRKLNKLLKKATSEIDEMFHNEDESQNVYQEEFQELRVINRYLELLDEISSLKRSVKHAEDKLDTLAHDKYPSLTEEEIKSLVIHDKWFATLSIDIGEELDRVSQSLVQRVNELAERYETTLPEVKDKVDALQEKVDTHLERMGFVWN